MKKMQYKTIHNIQNKDSDIITKKDIESIPEKDHEFWIIEVEKEIVHGPFNEEEFQQERKNISVLESMELKELDSYKKDFEYA
ncbi:DUF3997 domain-containing protein [Clostridium gasigenes]|uniref:DUF3997 domain-containing protein n=1 Tax=Clostridium gasigenes TaxID=94869 RepID=UPI001C0CA432|nr:DUF3997 domain-containing protein [Clostridium gasigenes]MBU3137949.1 DUF3997 domain-containing protein [Clostridium gasigenes]